MAGKNSETYYYYNSLKNIADEYKYLTVVPENSKLPQEAYRFNPASINK